MEIVYKINIYICLCLLDTIWNGQTSQLIVSSAESSATLRGLTPVTLYYIRVIAENVLGQSEPSDVSEITTEEEGKLQYCVLYVYS